MKVKRGVAESEAELPGDNVKVKWSSICVAVCAEHQRQMKRCDVCHNLMAANCSITREWGGNHESYLCNEHAVTCTKIVGGEEDEDEEV